MKKLLAAVVLLLPVTGTLVFLPPAEAAPAPDPASLTVTGDAPPRVLEMIRAAVADAERLQLGDPLAQEITVTIHEAPYADAAHESGEIRWPESGYDGAPEWWQQAMATHEVAHVFAGVGGHGPGFRVLWDQLLSEIDVVATYTPGATYPELSQKEN